MPRGTFEWLEGDSQDQIDSFQNATLQSAGGGKVISIAVHLPDDYKDRKMGFPGLRRQLRRDFQGLMSLGYTVEVMGGEDDEEDPFNGDPAKVVPVLTEFFNAAEKGGTR